MLTFGEAKKFLAQYAGRGGSCPSDRVNMFVREVLEYLIYSGAYQNLRKYTFVAIKGIFTIPYEIESIQKVKIDNEVGQVWDQWFEFRNARQLDGQCIPPDEALFEEPNYYATAYDLPYGGARVGVMGTCDEEDDALLLVQGKDITGREVFTVHNGAQVSGEYLRIRKGELRYTQVTFSGPLDILKPKTNGYVQLYGLDPSCNKRTFLSDYSPLEQKPAYRRYRITSRKCGPYVKVDVLARIRLKEAYADTDRIPVETLLTLRLAAQAINADYNNDVQTAQAKDQRMTTIISRENEHKRVQNGSPIEFFYPLSAGAIRNTIWRKI